MRNLSYGYDALGNVSSRAAGVEGVNQTVSYDTFNRFTDTTITNPHGQNERGANYGTPGGNITSRTTVGVYTYGENGAGPHALTTISHQRDLSHYAYDAAGRMTSGGGLSEIDWNWAGEASKLAGAAATLNLTYTPDGELLTKNVSGAGQWRYFGKLFVQTGSDGWRERIVADGEVIAIVNVSSAGYPSVDYMIHDNLGSPAAIVNASGVLEGRYAWNA